ncbi:hypothetical protein F2Q70_00031760 [Brassica cretica]|uniref:Retrotransposon gag domain-containing protein n=1 Tax=Brassica cretica TaxID=69181 RepID=A0A8S9FLG8_BRACR|nr:hypothetical protein F2Q70_00031760 [Brassica cretica]
MDTRSITALSDMSKQIDELRSSQVQQTEEIRKELGGEINALKGIIENFFTNAQPFTQCEGKQTEASSEITDGTPQTTDPPDQLVSLKQGNDTIDMYLDKFDCAMTRLTLAPGHALSIFLTNMHQHLALHVRQFKVNSVPEAAKIAKLHKLSLMQTPSRTARSSYNTPQRSQFSQPNKNQYSNSTPPANTNISNQNNKPLIANTPQKRLSLEEMQERKSLCMFCDEQFTPGQQLKHQRAEFLFLEAETEFDEEIALVEQIRETTLEDDQDDKIECFPMGGVG